MKEKYMVIDVALCHDCNNCFMACTDEHAGNEWPGYQRAMPRHGHRWMDILRRERGQNDRIDAAFLPKPCFQCGGEGTGDGAPCMRAGEFVKRREDGIVVFDLEAPGQARGDSAGKDISAACPYGAIWWNEEAGVSQKCDFCAHLLDDGAGWEHGVPRCVHSCPTGALRFFEEEAGEFAKRAEEEGLEVYGESGASRDGRTPFAPTGAHVYYKNLYRFTKNFVTGAVLRGGDCAKGVTVRIACAGHDASGVTLRVGEADVAGSILAEQVTDGFGEYKFDGLGDGEYAVFAEGHGEIGRAVVSGGSVDLGDVEVG